MNIEELVPATERRYGYLSDLSGLEFQEGEPTLSWIHAAPINRTYKHPLYGTIKFTAEKVNRMAQNIKAGVRGIDIAIDYAHRAGDKAAGWVRDAEVRSDGLWLLVEWTPAAAEAIRNKEFRYFSPEFVDTYVDAGGTGKTYKDVLLGGGLTNRPFLKDLLPVNLSEVLGETDTTEDPDNEASKEEDPMPEFLKKLREQLGLPEDATEEQILAAVKASESDPQASGADSEELRKKLDEAIDTIAQLKAAQRLTEVKYQLAEWQRGGEDRKFALPPALEEKVRDIMTKSSVQLGEQFAEFMNELLKVGLVSLEEKGAAGRRSRSENEGREEEDATKRFNDLVAKILEENPEMEIGDAVEEAARRDEQLYNEYRESAYTFKEDD